MSEKDQVGNAAIKIALNSQWAKEQKEQNWQIRGGYFTDEDVKNIQETLNREVMMLEMQCLNQDKRTLLFWVTDNEPAYDTACKFLDETYGVKVIPSQYYHKVEVGLVNINDEKLIKNQSLVPQRR
jgi:hypothetical protein